MSDLKVRPPKESELLRRFPPRTSLASLGMTLFSRPAKRCGPPPFLRQGRQKAGATRACRRKSHPADVTTFRVGRAAPYNDGRLGAGFLILASPRELGNEPDHRAHTVSIGNPFGGAERL